MDKRSQQEREVTTSVKVKEEKAPQIGNRSPEINKQKRKRDDDEENAERSNEPKLKVFKMVSNIKDMANISQEKHQWHKTEFVKKKKNTKKRERSSDDISSAEAEEEQELKKPRLEPERPNPLLINNYSFHLELGSGYFGRVMLASLTNTRKHVALKIIKKTDKLRDQEAIKIEAQTLRITGKCPFLCKGLAAFQTKLHAFLVMECVNKTSLYHLITTKKKLEMETVIFYSAELVVGLQFLHSRGIVHRDLKLENILVNKDGHIKIVDFGLAAHDIFGDKKLTVKCGSILYMAPEILLRKPYDAGADWWAFGIILSELATGRSPFLCGWTVESVIHQVTNGKPCYPAVLSTETRNLLDELFEKDPERRLGTKGDIRSHPFYSSIDWAELESLKIPSPLKPEGFSAKDFSEKYTGLLPFLEDPMCDASSNQPVVLQEFSYLSSGW